jgi:hypothetical protein
MELERIMPASYSQGTSAWAQIDEFQRCHSETKDGLLLKKVELDQYE